MQLVLTTHWHSDGHSERAIDWATQKPAHRRFAGGDHALEALRVRDAPEWVAARRSQDTDELLAIRSEQNDVVPRGLGLLDACSFRMERDQISLFERFRVRERLQDADCRRHLALQSGGLGAGGLDQSPLSGRPLLRDESPHHGACKHHHGQRGARGQQQEK